MQSWTLASYGNIALRTSKKRCRKAETFGKTVWHTLEDFFTTVSTELVLSIFDCRASAWATAAKAPISWTEAKKRDIGLYMALCKSTHCNNNLGIEHLESHRTSKLFRQTDTCKMKKLQIIHHTSDCNNRLKPGKRGFWFLYPRKTFLKCSCPG